MDNGSKVYLTTREGFRNWLEKHHQSESEIWLVLFKEVAGKQTLTYAEAVEEALCFDWVDSQMKTIDDEKFVQRFSPRKPGSNWTEKNRVRPQKMLAEGKMTPAGLESLPSGVDSGEND